jgi:hypothetical protein
LATRSNKNIGIVGTRRRNTKFAELLVESKFLEVYEEGDWIVSGGCPKGADRFAEIIAKRNGVPIIIFYPNWEKYGKSAGFIRNESIAFHSNVLIACVAKSRTGGTEDTIRKYKKFHGEKDSFELIIV